MSHEPFAYQITFLDTLQPIESIHMNITPNGKDFTMVQNKRICYIATNSQTLSTFILGTAAYLHEYGNYEVALACAHNTDFSTQVPQTFRFFPIRMTRGIDAAGLISVLQLFHLFRRERFDIIQYCTPNASFYSAIAGLFARVPVRLYCQWGIRYVGFSGWRRLAMKTVEKITCLASTWIEPDSHGNLAYSHAQGLYPPTKSSVVWNGSASGVDLQRFDSRHRTKWREEIRESLDIDHSTFVVGFVGRITRDKGINELLASWVDFSRQHDDCILLVVGSIDLAGVDAALWEWATESASVVYHERTPEPEKFYAAFDVLALPSYREGFGSVVVEAEAVGTPVIVTDIPGPLDAMKPGRTGLVIAVRDSPSLSHALQVLYADRGLLRRMSKECIQFARDNFDAERYRREVLLDRDLLLRKRGTRQTAVTSYDG